MYNPLNELRKASMKPLIKKAAKTHGRFLTQAEFEAHRGEIAIITGAVNSLYNRERITNKLNN